MTFHTLRQKVCFSSHIIWTKFFFNLLTFLHNYNIVWSFNCSCFSHSISIFHIFCYSSKPRTFICLLLWFSCLKQSDPLFVVFKTLLTWLAFENMAGYFLTKIFHPNIATNGAICVNTLKKDWNPTLGLRHVLIVSILAVLIGKVS